MKKSLLLSVCLAFASLSSFGASLASIMLQHNGNVTMYDPDKMTAAITAAAKGDTIYLNEGAFVGDFTINKEITIIGAGQDSKINGNITISIDNTPTLTAHMLDAVNISGYSVTVSKALNNLKIRKCYISTIKAAAALTDLNVDRSYINRVELSTNYKSGNFINCYIYEVYSSNSSLQNTINYINCNIFRLYQYNSNCMRGTFINSIINGYASTNNMQGCIFINTLYKDFSISTNSTIQNCYTSAFSFTEYTEEKTKINYYTVAADYLKDNNYVGTDGTIVGMFGGATPYNLVPNVPTVTESKVTVDTATKKLNVSLKVSAN